MINATGQKLKLSFSVHVICIHPLRKHLAMSSRCLTLMQRWCKIAPHLRCRPDNRYAHYWNATPQALTRPLRWNRQSSESISNELKVCNLHVSPLPKQSVYITLHWGVMWFSHEKNNTTCRHQDICHAADVGPCTNNTIDLMDHAISTHREICFKHAHPLVVVLAEKLKRTLCAGHFYLRETRPQFDKTVCV